MKINDYFLGVVFIPILKEKLQNEEGELSLVLAEYTKVEGPGQRSEFLGLDIALSLDSAKVPIIFTSYMPEEYFAHGSGYSEKDKGKFHSLMARNRVGYLRLPFTSDDLLAKYNELIGNKKEEDILAIEINRINSFESKMGVIQHTAQRFIREDSDQARQIVSNAVSKAREAGAIGSDEEVAEQIKNFKHQPKSSIFAGKFFPGVFCDVEGTLIKDGEINIEMLTKLKELSRTKPITLWTGGNVEELGKILAKNSIKWKLISKRDLTGAEVETSYDDEDFYVFFEKYGVKVQNFNKI